VLKSCNMKLKLTIISVILHAIFVNKKHYLFFITNKIRHTIFSLFFFSFPFLFFIN
jgi:hypothetical protein